MIGRFLGQISAAQPPALCLLCDCELSAHSLEAVVMMTAYRDRPSVAICNGLCAAHAAAPDLLGAIATKYRELIPDVRRVVPVGEAGHA